MPFKVAPPIKCCKCDKAVYANDKQISLDGLIYHGPCAKCADCGCNISVSNFAVVDGDNGEKTLLCKVHYKARFNAAGGVYAGGSKYAKQSERENVSKHAAASAGAGSSPSPVVKGSSGEREQADYKLDKSVTTPDKRPSLKIGANSNESEIAPTPELQQRRASLKSVSSAAKAEIEEEASKTVTVTDGPCGSDGCKCVDCNCGPDCKCSAGNPGEKCTPAPTVEGEGEVEGKKSCCSSKEETVFTDAEKTASESSATACCCVNKTDDNCCKDGCTCPDGCSCKDEGGCCATGKCCAGSDSSATAEGDSSTGDAVDESI